MRRSNLLSSKFIAVLLSALLAQHTVIISPIFALTEGPSQPEVQSFEPITTTELVNPFTGDFTYNIPLMNIGGYPINLTYQSGVNMDQEASFVGLGWNLNPGVINRNVRGLPDDFAGEEIVKHLNLEENKTTGITIRPDFELFGYEGTEGILEPELNIGINHNTYRGVGVDLGFSTGVQAAIGAKTQLTVGLGVSSNNGVSIEPSLSLTEMARRIDYADVTSGTGIGLNWNSRNGLEAITLKRSFAMKWARTGRNDRLSAGAQWTFASPTYTPAITTPMRNRSISLRLKLGGEIIGLTGTIDVAGYESRQTVAFPHHAIPAYGYLYPQKAGNATYVLHDFNREHDGSFVPSQPNLPLTQYTYDLYAVSGQGLQGQFRPYRSDIGTVFDHEVVLKGLEGGNIGWEAAGGYTLKVGESLIVNRVENRAGKWEINNATTNIFRFRGDDPDNPKYEPVYFKQIGELSAMKNRERFSAVGEFDAMRVSIRNQGAEARLANRVLDPGKETVLSDENLAILGEREPRNLHFSYLTASETAEMGLEKELRTYIRLWKDLDFGHGEIQRYDAIPRVNETRKPHHISEITVTRDDGTRYVYGLPAYNMIKEEVSFNVSGRGEPEDGLISYDAGTHDTNANTLGDNHYFSKTETPPYAYAYLITAIVSPDYVDVKGDGPTSDDLGTYTKFNYRRYHTNYRWRTPYHRTGGKASYQEGHHSDKRDNVASYIYGEKEVWYLHSIETRNYVAEFQLTERSDAIGVNDRSGGIATAGQKLYKLDEIRLFNKAERLTLKVNAVPIKTVHFKYNYSLTPGVPNNIDGGGKLTLQRVAFSYRQSQKGMLSPYVFQYGFNPPYQRQGSDRWGQYKPDSTELPNRRFPYAEQRNTREERASAWHLTGIRLPSGGHLRIEYEPDDYAYVQNRRAQMMFPIAATGFADSPDNCPGAILSEARLYENDRNYSCFYFNLLKPLDGTQDAELAEYVHGIDELYVNTRIRVDKRKNLYEEIQSFLPLTGAGDFPAHGFDPSSLTSGLYTRAWIKVQSEPLRNGGIRGIAEGTEIHPLAQAAWQYIKLNLPKLVYTQPDRAEREKIEDLGPATADALARIWENIQDTVSGLYSRMKTDERADRIDLMKSFMRLNHPTKNKLGGGSRVKSITLNDRWGTMTQRTGTLRDELNYDYRQEFEYITADNIGDTGQTISSGVAAYEPLLGGDENPFVQPIRYEHNDEPLFQLAPIGESLFPAPVVGYSKVTVRHVKPTEGSRITGTGYTIHEFYTARDFPAKVRQTPLMKDQNKSVDIISPIPESTDFIAASQGFVIKLNDMHGKPKATWIYPDSKEADGSVPTPISGNTYHYRLLAEDPTHLDNEVNTLVKKGDGVAIERNYVGLDYDVIVDAREHDTFVEAPGFELNTDGFLAALFPVLIPTPYPKYSSESTRFRSIVMTKVIHQVGILSELRAHESGASLGTYNELWDADTGQVVVTSTETEHGMPRYTTRIPAHLEYDGMAGAWMNQGLTLHNLLVKPNGILAFRGASDYFIAGDELFLHPAYEIGVDKPPATLRAWVWQVHSNGVTLLDFNGAHLPNGYYQTVRIYRSGRRNQQTASIGQVESLDPPVGLGGTAQFFKDVINAAAVEYADHWQTYAAFYVHPQGGRCQCTPLNLEEPPPLLAATEPLPQHVALKILLEVLDGEGALSSKEIDLRSVAPPRVRSTLDTRDTLLGWRYWEGQIEGSMFRGAITDDKGRVLCHITLRNPDGLFTEELLSNLDFGTINYRRDYSYECGDTGKFVIRTRPEGESPTSQVIFGDSECFTISACKENPNPPSLGFRCGLSEGEAVNPFTAGILGNWRPRRAWSYLTDRVSSDRRFEAGTYQRFEPFWSRFPGSNRTNWHWTEETTVINPLGRAQEGKDALGRYQSALHGFDFSVATASARNARPSQVASDSFEDYAYTNRIKAAGECPAPTHWSFQRWSSKRDAEHSHTGRYSLKLNNESVSLTRRLEEPCSGPRTVPAGPRYLLQRCDLISPFSPTLGRYIVSTWVKTQSGAGPTPDSVPVTGPAVTVSVGTLSKRLIPKGNAVDGWQRIMGEFEVPPSATIIDVTLQSGPVVAWFDDIRIHPFDGHMETYVYDPIDLRFRASLNVNNYATFYDYDEEGALSRQGLETVEGIKTVREVSFGKPKFP